MFTFRYYNFSSRKSLENIPKKKKLGVVSAKEKAETGCKKAESDRRREGVSDIWKAKSGMTLWTG